jgi:hypothetical protein
LGLRLASTRLGAVGESREWHRLPAVACFTWSMASARSAKLGTDRAASATLRQPVPVVVRRTAQRPGHHGLKLVVGVIALLAISGVCAVAGFQAIQSIGEGERVTAEQRYLDGDGEDFDDEEGEFLARFPDTPGPRGDNIEMFGGRVDLVGWGSKIGDLSVSVSWFDLTRAPKPDQAVGVLSGVAVYLAKYHGVAPSDGHVVEGAAIPTYEFAVDLPPEADDTEPIVILRRLLLVGDRVYALRVDAADARVGVMRYFASTFRSSHET